MNRRVAIVVGLFIALASAGAVLGIFAEGWKRTGCGADAFSRSYVGHKALVEFLNGAGFDVVVNRKRLSKGREGGVRGLAVLEPSWDRKKKKRPWIRWREGFDRVLVALPKWEVSPKLNAPDEIGRRGLLREEDIEGLLEGGAPESIERRITGQKKRRVRFGDRGPAFDLEVESIQTFAGVLDSLVVARTEEGVLVARDRRDRGLFWVADPDAFSNGALGRAENAPFVEELFSRVFPDRALVLDEVHHGFEWRPSLLATFFTFPGVVATINVVLLLLFLLWSLTTDWGGQETRPGMERSRLEQARNVGRLMVRHGWNLEGLALYVKNVKDSLCERFHLDRRMTPEALAAYLEKYDSRLAMDARAFLKSAGIGRRRGSHPSDRQTLSAVRGAFRLLKRGHDAVHSRLAEEGGGRAG